MAGAAIRAELAIVRVVGCMAGITIGWCAFKLASRVTGRTIHPNMLSCEGEAGFGVIESGISPSRGIMARAAIRAELTVMRVVSSMAGIAIGGRTLKLTIYVAGSAIDANVHSG